MLTVPFFAYTTVVSVVSQCVSNTARSIVASAQCKLLSKGKPPSGELACYADIAEVMNDFVDIMNGALHVTMLQRRCHYVCAYASA